MLLYVAGRGKLLGWTPPDMFLQIAPAVLWPTVAGIVLLAIGLITVWGQLTFHAGKLAAVGPAFVAAGLAAFGVEHFVAARAIMLAVPSWMPGRLFWTYFVGIALLAAALSLALQRFVRLTATLLGTMFLLFVLLIHLRNVVSRPEQLFWVVLLRDLAFGGGAWALAGGRLAVFGRCWIAAAALFFAVVYFLHPEIAPGVPLVKLTPAWVPLHLLWGYPMGAALLLTGIAVLVNRYSRKAATVLAIMVTLSVALIYIPIMVLTPTVEAMNYVADTLLFAGTIWLLAQASPVN
jgi:uncharacterized membrane protein